MVPTNLIVVRLFCHVIVAICYHTVSGYFCAVMFILILVLIWGLPIDCCHIVSDQHRNRVYTLLAKRVEYLKSTME